MQLESTLNNIFKLPNFAIHSNTIPISVLTEETGKRGMTKGRGGGKVRDSKKRKRNTSQ